MFAIASRGRLPLTSFTSYCKASSSIINRENAKALSLLSKCTSESQRIFQVQKFPAMTGGKVRPLSDRAAITTDTDPTHSLIAHPATLEQLEKTIFYFCDRENTLKQSINKAFSQVYGSRADNIITAIQKSHEFKTDFKLAEKIERELLLIQELNKEIDELNEMLKVVKEKELQKAFFGRRFGLREKKDRGLYGLCMDTINTIPTHSIPSKDLRAEIKEVVAPIFSVLKVLYR